MKEHIHIGQVLVEQGILNEQQVFEILQAQRSQSLPFGVLAEQMFEVTIESIECAWAQQYHRMTGTLDLSTQTVDPQVLGLINRRQAWQFEMLPLYTQPDGDVVVAASSRRLARAVTFAASRIKPIVYFRIAERQQLRHFLHKHYPMPEVPDALMDRVRQMSAAPPAGDPSQQD